MTATLGNFIRISLKQLDAREAWQKKWNPKNKKTRKYFTALNRINRQAHKALKALTEDDKQTIRDQIEYLKGKDS